MKLSLKQFEEQIFFASVRIVPERDKGKGSSIGTGFIYSLKIDDKKSVLLLISNRHVLKDSKRLSLVLNRQQKTKPAPRLGDTIHYNLENFAPLCHPDKSVDLACINISGITNDPLNKAFYKILHSEVLSGLAEDGLPAGSTVWFVGYPENRFDVRNNLPILRSGTIASIPSVNFNGKRQFIIDAQVFPGSSGSPVFTIIGNNYRLTGVVSQTMIRNQEIQVLPANVGVGVEQVLGLGIVIKASELDRLFKKVVERMREKSRQ